MTKTDKDPATAGSYEYMEGRSSALAVTAPGSDRQEFYDAPMMRAAFRAGWDAASRQAQTDRSNLIHTLPPMDQSLIDAIRLIQAARQDVQKLFGGPIPEAPKEVEHHWPERSPPMMGDGRPAWQQMQDLMDKIREQRPAFRLRDELVAMFLWAKYGWENRKPEVDHDNH